MVDAPFQWIDLDPFGSPVGFLDTAIQSISRVGVLEVTATDIAALWVQQKQAQQEGTDRLESERLHA